MTENSKMPDSDGAAKSSKPLEVLRSAFMYFKLLGGCLLVYGLGYLKMSPSWLLFGCFAYLVHTRASQKRSLVIHGLKTIGRNEQKTIMEHIAVRELPSWVYFPDEERAEWLNNVIKRMWPYINDYATEIIMDSVQPSIDKSLPDSLRPFKFTKVDLGDTPPRIGGVKVYMNDNIHRDEIVMDIDLMLYSDARIKVQVGKIVAGVKEFVLRGKMRVLMKPLVPKIPFAGAVTVCFLDNPEINFLLTDMGNLLSLPGLQNTLMSTIRDVVGNMLVIPNRLPVQLVNEIDLRDLRFPMPKGVVRINVVSARDLKASDVNLMGKSTSDPYCILRVGAQKYTTKTCYKTCNPSWNEYFEAVVAVRTGQTVELEVWDKDQGNRDDQIGTATLPFETALGNGAYDNWVKLEGVKRGSVHLKMEWLSLSSNPADFKQQGKEFARQFGASMSSGYLFVLVEQAKNLSFRRAKSNDEPSAYASVSLGHERKTTDIKPRTQNPTWDTAFNFLVENPEMDALQVIVRDSKTETKLGECKVHLKRLLSEENMRLACPFQLKDSGTDGNTLIYLVVEMRALVVDGERPDQIPRSPESSSPEERRSVSPSQLVDTAVKRRNVNGASHDHSTVGEVSSQASPLPPPSDRTGRVLLTAHYCAEENTLSVVLHRCSDLLGVDKDGLADPYVKIYVKFKNGVSYGEKKKSQVKKNTLNPEFEERFVFTVEADEVADCNLHVDVKNHVGRFSRSGSVHYIGSVVIPITSASLATGFQEWHWLQPTEGMDESRSVRSDS